VRPDLRHFVEHSLRALEREAPTFHSRLCETVTGLRVCIRSEGEPFALHFHARSVASLSRVRISLRTEAHLAICHDDAMGPSPTGSEWSRSTATGNPVGGEKG
jgi:hypothetical protein